VKRIVIEPVAGTTLAEDKDAAAELRRSVILPALDAGEPVLLDFRKIETATQSFIHALIAEAVRHHAERAFDLLEFKNCGPGVQHIVRTVFEYTLLARDTAGGAAPQQPQL
jgi:hypothetical protein